jgi:3'(2'), 5'-bisphosphate nucleotidase
LSQISFLTYQDRIFIHNSIKFIFFIRSNEMRQSNWDELFPKVCQLAEEAGQAIMRIYTESADVDMLVAQKSDDSPLTLADLASHHIIMKGLALLTPDIPVVSEEDPQSLIHRKPQGCFWLIDPLDGTKEFLARQDEFTVNIALIEDGQPVWGVVHAPAVHQLFWGGQAFGSFRKDESGTVPLAVSPPAKPENLIRAVVSRSHLNAETSAFVTKLGSVAFIRAGSSLKFCRVAEGNADVYPRIAPTSEWDTAAAHALIEGAGGYVYNIHGARLQYGKPDLLNPGFIAASVPFEQLNLDN